MSLIIILFREVSKYRDVTGRAGTFIVFVLTRNVAFRCTVFGLNRTYAFL